MEYKIILDYDPTTQLALFLLPSLALLILHALQPHLPPLRTFQSPSSTPPKPDPQSDATSPTARRTTQTALVATLSAAHGALWIALGVWGALGGEGSWGEMVGRLGTAGVWITLAARVIKSPPVTVPYLVLSTTLLSLLTAVLSLFHFFLHAASSSLVPLSTHLLLSLSLLLLLLSFPLSPPYDSSSSSPDSESESPEESVTLLEWISFSWVGPLIAKGSRIAKENDRIKNGETKKRLEYEDVWALSRTMTCEGVREGEKRGKRLMPRIWYNNSRDISLSLGLGLLSAALAYTAPYFLKKILEALQSPPDDWGKSLRLEAYVYAILALLAQVIRAEVDLQQLWHERRLIVRTRSQLMGEVYEKALKRRDLSGVILESDLVVAGEDKGKKREKEKKEQSDKTGGKGSTGKIVSLMTSDTGRVANQLMGLSSIVAAPFELIVAITFLYQLLGWSSLAGLSVMALSLPINHVLVRRRIKLHRSVLTSRDKRMEVLNEFIQAIRFVKYSASEKSWLGRVFLARETELGWLLKTRLNNLMMNVVWNFTPDLVMLISFACFTKIIGKQLTVPIAFTALALFALVRAPMSMLPSSVTQLLQTYVSIQRLEAFFNEPEVEPWVSSLSDGPASSTSSPFSTRVAIEDATFKYQDITSSTATAEAVQQAATDAEGDSAVAFELRDVSVDFPVGKLSLVCGPTGSGKSSLFLALLGEMDRIKGTVYLPKSNDSIDDPATNLYNGVAYTAQQPWLEHASIRDNILFGARWEEQRYKDVLGACALETDLEMFEAGDQTEIGEKGISLSGGQKARVALARAVYSRAKTVLLDDPLSAIDMHTARHVYHKCLKGPLMEHRTIILITHHVSLCLSGADYLVRISSGRVTQAGPISEFDKSTLVSSLVDDGSENTTEPVDVIEDLDGSDTTVVQAPVADVPAPEVESQSQSLAPTRVPSPVAEASEVVGAKAKLVGAGGKLIEEETRATGRVQGRVYSTYLSAAGWDTWSAIVVLLLIGRGLRVGDRYWFKLWGESYRSIELSLASLFMQNKDVFYTMHDVPFNHTLVTNVFPSLPSASDNVNPYLIIYGLICIANILVIILGILAGYRGSFRAARLLFTQTLTRVAHAPFRYYDTTPTGRIFNRFSSDFIIIDQSLTDQVRTVLTQAFSFVINIAVIVVVSPAFLAPAVFIIFLYVRLSLSYVRCSRDLRRLESNARSPIYSKFTETLAGMVTCRAFGAERRFRQNLFNSVDKMLASHYASAMVNRYLLWRFDCLGAIAVAITTFLSLSSGASPGLAALAITSAQSLVQSVYWLCRYISALEVDLNAVERVIELLEVPQEPPMIISAHRPPAIWPSAQGGVVFDDLVLSYAPTLPPVLRNISFEIQPREKVGVVGRTGSGKSTMALSLLRFAEPTSGKILIDGIDITTIGLADLRSRITLIPQDAVLFSGTIRTNLDPFVEHTDADCLDALERVGMTSSPRDSVDVSAAPSASASVIGDAEPSQGRLSVTLDSHVSQGGHNFSAGQRQLLAMARALLRRNRVVIMDEATAQVDYATDEMIQRTIREEFRDALVVTIAHRLRTVIDYDKVLVLDSGAMVEFDSPRNLLQREGGAFRKMCESSPDWETLKRLAGV